MAIETTITVPDIGNYKDVEIIEVLVKPGDTIRTEDSLITLESDKAAMEIPSPSSGTVKAMNVKVGDRVSEGTPILTLLAEDVSEAAAAPAAKPPQAEPEPAAAAKAAEAPAPEVAQPVAAIAEKSRPSPAAILAEPVPEAGKPHASPSVRRFARELGADIGKIKGSGPKGRILREDVQSFVKASLQRPAPALGFAFPESPEIDFAQYGPIETRPLSRIKKLSAANLHRNWVTIPHVTHHEEADITELEAFRQSLKAEAERQDLRVTLLPFLIKAVVTTLKAFPNFNASLAPNGEELILKQYYHVGLAIDTPEGLVVPPVRDADRKGVFQLARELAELGERARGKKLRTPELQGGTFTISSLGGIGGTGFTPIINAPEVAILGVSKAQTKPGYRDGQIVPRLMLPLSLSFDHRVIDGADAARFCAYLAQVLTDLRRVLL
jgi:pyruvate dehydrogenase E2 component (dihydrolipoamide acetyltransferase)